MSLRFIAAATALALSVAGCSSSTKPSSVVARPATTTTTSTTTTTTTTTTLPPEPATVLVGDIGPQIRTVVEMFYDVMHDPSRSRPPGMGPAFYRHVAERSAPDGEVRAAASWARLENGDQVAVVTVRRDAILLVNTGDGWTIAGAFLAMLDPWLGRASPRNLLVLGTDARIGERQLGLRADSVHVLTMVPSTGQGALLGFPRDSWLRGSKLTNLMPLGGPDLMMEVITEVSGLELEGWVAVGFEGFLGLMKELGRLQIDLPTTMRSGNEWTDYPAGPQTLGPELTLRLARIRKGLPRGDFDRTFNQGLIIKAAMAMVQDMGIDQLPRWVAAFDEHAFTNLDTKALLTFLATAYVSSPDDLANLVVPGVNGSVGAAAVVFITGDAEAVFRNLDDGVYDEPEA